MPTNVHPDPLVAAAPSQANWPRYWRRAQRSQIAQEFRAALQLSADTPVRDSVIDDLCTYYRCSPEECVEECVHWGRYFDEEWDAAASPAEFHRTSTSSSFSLLWWAYLQSQGYGWPGAVGAAEATLRSGLRSGRHLDFGAGVGATSQLFARIGFETTVADISTSMLDFARFRFERRGTPARFLDLNDAELPRGAYDVITALAVLWLVPDFEGTVQTLHAALKPGGLLFADITPSKSKDARWQLYSEDLPLRRQLHRAGFEPIIRLPYGGTLYRRVSSHGAAHAARGARDAVMLSPLRQAYRNVRDRVAAG
jgi:2-polyprenyl-3-methyl-5-hydroxy-6-metoxy-1,4-benzoquinol methylase